MLRTLGGLGCLFGLDLKGFGRLVMELKTLETNHLFNITHFRFSLAQY